MNDLSWLLYWAEVSDKTSGIFGFGLFIFGLFGGLAVVGVWANAHIECQKAPAGLTMLWAAIVMPLLVGFIFAPSSRTLYSIAASEIGETVVTHPDTIEMMNDLKSVIKKRLKEELN